MEVGCSPVWWTPRPQKKKKSMISLPLLTVYWTCWFWGANVDYTRALSLTTVFSFTRICSRALDPHSEQFNELRNSDGPHLIGNAKSSWMQVNVLQRPLPAMSWWFKLSEQPAQAFLCYLTSLCMWWWSPSTPLTYGYTQTLRHSVQIFSPRQHRHQQLWLEEQEFRQASRGKFTFRCHAANLHARQRLTSRTKVIWGGKIWKPLF